MKFQAGDRIKLIKSKLDQWCDATEIPYYSITNDNCFKTLKEAQIPIKGSTMWRTVDGGDGRVFPEEYMEKVVFRSGDRVKISISKLKEFVKKEGLLESAYRGIAQEDFIATLMEIYHDKWSSTAWSVTSPDNIHIYPEYAMDPIMTTPKYRIVVKDAPKHREEINVDYEFLERNNACVEAKVAFVRNYGSDNVRVKDVIAKIYNVYGSGCYGYIGQDIIFDPITKTHHAPHLRQLDDEHKRWVDWLITKTGYEEEQILDESKYVLLKNASHNKIYILKFHAAILKIYLITEDKIYYVSMRDSIKQDMCIKNISPECIIYEFENERDFAEWYHNEVMK